jgi:hypothetical protein
MDLMLEDPLTKMKARKEERRTPWRRVKEKNEGQPARDQGTIRALVNPTQSKLEATTNKRG